MALVTLKNNLGLFYLQCFYKVVFLLFSSLFISNIDSYASFLQK